MPGASRAAAPRPVRASYVARTPAAVAASNLMRVQTPGMIMVRNRFFTASIAASMLVLTATGARTRPVWMPFDALQAAAPAADRAARPIV